MSLCSFFHYRCLNKKATILQMVFRNTFSQWNLNFDWNYTEVCSWCSINPYNPCNVASHIIREGLLWNLVMLLNCYQQAVVQSWRRLFIKELYMRFHSACGSICFSRFKIAYFIWYFFMWEFHIFVFRHPSNKINPFVLCQLHLYLSANISSRKCTRYL